MGHIAGMFIAPHPPILIHEIGKGKEREAGVTLHGLNMLTSIAEELDFDVILCITPHAPMFSNAMCILDFQSYEGGLESFGHKTNKVWQKDTQLIEALVSRFEANALPFVRMNESEAVKYKQPSTIDHGSAVPMSLIFKSYHKKLACLSPGFLDKETLYNAGKAIREAALHQKSNVLILVSGDLSHCHGKGSYEYTPEGPEFDKRLEKALAAGNREVILRMNDDFLDKAGTCAYKPIVMGLGVFEGHDADFQVYSNEAPWGVGYLTASILPTGLKKRNINYTLKIEKKVDDYVELAKETIEKYTGHRVVPAWKEFAWDKDEAFIRRCEDTRAGAFVSLHKGGELRGCIGTILPTQDCLADEIMYSAVQACSEDPRFGAVREEELPYLDIKVDIMGQPEKIEDVSMLDVKKYGVIVEKGGRRGLLLPDLEGVDTVEKQISIAMRKAGILDGSKIDLYRFEVERHG